MKRRNFLIQSGSGALTSIIGGGILIQIISCNTDEGMMMAEAPSIVEGAFDREFLKPPVTGALVELEAQLGISELKAGISSSVYGYHSAGILGPTIEVTSGEMLSVNLINALNEPTNIHWHGLLTPADMDGHPADVIGSGGSFNYAFPVINRAGMYWYHAHPDLSTASQAYLGLAGLFRVSDAEELALVLPSGEFEIPLVIQDKLLSGNSDLSYSTEDIDIMNGLHGDHVLVNGIYAPFLNISTRVYRLRVLNGSNARIYNLSLSNGHSFMIIGSDGGLLAYPEMASSILLSPGERVDILVDFSGLSMGSEVFLQSETFSGSIYQGKQAFNIMKFVVDQIVPDTFTAPSTLSAFAVIPESQSIRNRTFDISNGGGHGGHGAGMAMHTINGKSYNESRIDETVSVGTTEIWTFDNTMGIDPHPMHLHGSVFQILGRTGGRGQLSAHEKGWKDTVLVMPGEKVRVIVQFGQDKGVFVFHCHNLEHEDSGMMLQMEIE